jgi:hypothetical protein
MLADAPLSPTVTQDRTERVLGHSPLRQAPPQSSFDATTALAFRRWQLPTRVSALFTTSPQRVHLSRGFPCPRYVPSSGVLSLSTVCSALLLVSLFHPTAALRALAHSGVWPLCTATLPHREELPPCRWNEARSPTSRLPRISLLDFEALLHAESRVAGLAVRPHQRPLPSSSSLLLQVSSLPLPPFAGNRRSWRLSPSSYIARTRWMARTSRLQRTDRRELGHLVSEAADLLELSSLPGTCSLSHADATRSRLSGPLAPGNLQYLEPRCNLLHPDPSKPEAPIAPKSLRYLDSRALAPRSPKGSDTSAPKARLQELRRAPGARLQRASVPRRSEELSAPRAP